MTELANGLPGLACWAGHEAFRNFDVDEFLTKPINPAELRAVIQKYLG